MGRRDMRQLIIALTAIVAAWSFAFALTLASTVLFDGKPNSGATWIGDPAAHQGAP